MLAPVVTGMSEIFESDAGNDPRLEEAADIMANLAEQAYTAGETQPARAASAARLDPYIEHRHCLATSMFDGVAHAAASRRRS